MNKITAKLQRKHPFAEDWHSRLCRTGVLFLVRLSHPVCGTMRDDSKRDKKSRQTVLWHSGVFGLGNVRVNMAADWIPARFVSPKVVTRL